MLSLRFQASAILLRSSAQMALSKPLFSHLKTLRPRPLPLRLLSFATPEEAAAERRRRKRRLRIEPPLSSHRPQQRIPGKPPANPNAPKLPESAASLSANRLNLHNKILALIRENDLEEASLLVRHSIYSNCRPTIFTCNAVLAALLRQARYPELLSLHRFITQAGVAPTVATHNLLLQVYCDARKTDTALEHYRLILKDSPFDPSPTTYRILVKGLVDNGKLDQAIELKEDMLTKGSCAPDPAVYNLLMAGLVKNDDPDRALALYDELKEKLSGGTIHDGIIYGSFMKSYFKKGMEKVAMDCYSEVLGEGSKVRFDAVSYNLVLDTLCKNGQFDEALRLFNRMMAEHHPPRRLAVNVGSFNVMVDGYCTLGRFSEAIEVFKRMGEKRCSPDALSYNNLIQQLGENKLVREAEEIYQKMGEHGINPDEYTYVLLIEACFGVDRMDDAVGFFEKMLEVGLRPNANAYNKVIGGLANVGKLGEAQNFFNRLAEKEVKPNVTSYELLLKAYCKADRLDDAYKTAKIMLLDESVEFRSEMKELLEETLGKGGRDKDMGRLYEEVEKEKAEALARAAEEKARAEVLAKEEEERKKAEAAAKEAAAARASAAAIEAILGKSKKKEEPPATEARASDEDSEKEVLSGSSTGEEPKAAEQVAAHGEVPAEVKSDSGSSEEKEGGDGSALGQVTAS